MKNNTLILLLFFVSGFANSQIENDSTTTTAATFNNYRWRFEIGTGESRGLRPFSEGYFSSNSQKTLGVIDLNSVTIGATYNYSELLGFKLDFAFDRFKDKDHKSLPFEVAQFRMTLQGVFNLNSLLKYQKESARLNFLFHAGFSLSTLQKISSSNDPDVGSRELNGGLVVGFTPMFRITKKIHVFFDFSSFYNYRQHYTWDGEYSKPNNNLSGQMINGTFGLTYSLGKQLKWKGDEMKKLEEKNEILEKRVGDMENKLIDTDKDGVADYLDSEVNSALGVVVDSKGKSIDTNKNGVADELEKYLEKMYIDKSDISKTVQTANDDFLKRSINEGYVTAFFEYNNAKPNNLSLDGINFILTYLRANPDVSIDIIGFSDEIGKSEKNEKLALERANNVKESLIKSGIRASRLNAISGGEDNSVDPTSNEARSMVRKVIFKLK